MKLPSTMLEAATLLPSNSPQPRSHSASNSSAAAPDKKKIALKRTVGKGPMIARVRLGEPRRWR